MESYLEFDLVLERVDAQASDDPSQARYVARVTDSPAGEAEAAFELPFQPFEVENFALKLGHRRGMRRSQSSSSAEARAFGQRLFNAVFAGEIALAYGRSLDEARRTNSGLRVRLRLEDQQLANIPWEFLHHEVKDDFLVLSKQTPLVRVLDVPRQLQSNDIELPLRVLVMVSSPIDQASLDVEAEYRRLESAMQDRIESGHIHMARVNGSMSDLQRALRQDQYHVLHFIGHGAYDQANDDGVLVLESATGNSEIVRGAKLGTLLYDEPTLQLVMLNACEGGRASDDDEFAGVAQSLIRKGLPAVIAMQFEISDAAAILLSHDFYSALSDGLPVDAALAEARKAVYASGDGVEWGTPVLYLQNSSSQVFRISDTLPAPRVSTTAARLDRRSRELLPRKRLDRRVLVAAIGVAVIALALAVFGMTRNESTPTALPTDDVLSSVEETPTTDDSPGPVTPEPVETESVAAPPEPSDIPDEPDRSVTCAESEVVEGAGCVALVTASCSSDVGPNIGVVEDFVLSANFDPAELDVQFEFDHGDGSAESGPNGSYWAPGTFETSMSWSVGEQNGVVPCMTFVVSGNPVGWQTCDAPNEPEPDRDYFVRNAGSGGLSLYVAPGTEMTFARGVFAVEIMGSLPVDSPHRFVGCWQREGGTEFWWEYEAGGFASASFIDTQ